jgi:hypothetical protein
MGPCDHGGQLGVSEKAENFTSSRTAVTGTFSKKALKFSAFKSKALVL